MIRSKRRALLKASLVMVSRFPLDSLAGAPRVREGIRVSSLVIIPAYNEFENLALLAPAVSETDPAIDVLVVDGSPTVPGSWASTSRDMNFQQRGVLSK